MSEKTEQPTPKRLRDARQKGQVPKSSEVPSALVVLALTLYLMARGETIFAMVSDMAATVFSLSAGPWDEALRKSADLVVRCSFNILAPLVILVVAASLAANLGQVGVLFSAKAAIPSLDNLSPGKWFKKTFSKKNAFEFLKNLLKVGVLSIAVWQVIDRHFRELFILPMGDINGLWSVLAGSARDLTLTAVAAFCVLAAIDYVYQRFSFTKEHMMSKDEVKREYKEMEGDPLIKSKRRQLHQEMANQSAVGRVKKAKVLITNPTHVAVALDYDQEKNPLPIILAKGEGHLAQRMIEAARAAGIPILRQAPLARNLYENGLEDSYIPKDLWGPVAEVLRWVQALSDK